MESRIINNLGRVIIISGPSGVGKSTLIRALVGEVSSLRKIVSHTTRKPRPGEQNGVDYYFVSIEIFSRLQELGDFIELKRNFWKYVWNLPRENSRSH